MEIVTAPNEAAERLAASESLLRLSQEAGHIGSYDWDIEGGPNLWSDEQCRLHGIEPSGARSITVDEWRSLMHPDDLAFVEQRIGDIIEYRRFRRARASHSRSERRALDLQSRPDRA